jgi:hypothetical protein
MVVGPVEADDHVALRSIKTDTPNKAAAGHICARERCKMERTSVFDVQPSLSAQETRTAPVAGLSC